MPTSGLPRGHRRGAWLGGFPDSYWTTWDGHAGRTKLTSMPVRLGMGANLKGQDEQCNVEYQAALAALRAGAPTATRTRPGIAVMATPARRRSQWKH